MLDSKTRRPRTVKSYFCSVTKFLDFILDHTGNEVEGMPAISEDSLKRAALVLPRVKSWGCSITKMYAADTWSKLLKDREEFINPESVEDMTQTKAATEAISLLKKSQVAEVNDREFVKIRDFLIARLQLENGQRPGPLESATLEEFKRAEQTKTGYIMHVAGHKNARLGPAPIYMSINLHSNINAYILNVRPLFAENNTQEVFVKSTDGTAFKEGKIGKRVTEWWAKAKDIKVSSTKMRKMAASTLHHTEDTDKKAVHRLMTHKPSTAEKYYMIDKLNEAAERGAMVLRKNLNLSDTVAIPPTDVPAGLTQQQLEDMDLLFADIVETNGPLTMDITRNRMSESMSLIEFVYDYIMVKRVYDSGVPKTERLASQTSSDRVRTIRGKDEEMAVRRERK